LRDLGFRFVELATDLKTMKSEDPFSRLLHDWNPQSPARDDDVIRGVMQALEPQETFFDWILREWFPKPRVLLPVAASLMIFAAGIQWARMVHAARVAAVEKWRVDATQPLGGASLAGMYTQLEPQAKP